MATILTFRKDTDAGGANLRRRETGEIIIFPGVRYERLGAGSPGVKSGNDSAKRATKRRTLV